MRAADSEAVTVLWLNHDMQAAGLEAQALPFPHSASPAMSDGGPGAPTAFFHLEVAEYQPLSKKKKGLAEGGRSSSLLLSPALSLTSSMLAPWSHQDHETPLGDTTAATPEWSMVAPHHLKFKSREKGHLLPSQQPQPRSHHPFLPLKGLDEHP